MLKGEPREIEMTKSPVEIEDVLRLDREIFGADRSGLLRSLDRNRARIQAGSQRRIRN